MKKIIVALTLLSNFAINRNDVQDQSDILEQVEDSAEDFTPKDSGNPEVTE